MRNRRLWALLEGATVRYATENAGNELWIILVAEAVEQLVIVTEIEVKAAGVNPSDVKATLGAMSHAVWPRTPGRDWAGVVVEGPNDLLGREVEPVFDSAEGRRALSIAF